MYAALKIWGVQFVLWFFYSWPFVRDILWPVLNDGKINRDEVIDALRKSWPVDAAGFPKPLVLPWGARFFSNK